MRATIVISLQIYNIFQYMFEYLPLEGFRALQLSQMYEIPGHKVIDEHQFDRYVRNGRQWGEEIKDIARNETHLLRQLKDIESIPEGDRAALILEALNYPGLEVQIAGIENIYSVSNASKKSLYEMAAQKVQEGLSSPNQAVQRMAAEATLYLLDNQKTCLRKVVAQKVQEGLSSPNPAVQRMAAEMIFCTLGEDTAGLIRQALNSPFPEVQKAGAAMTTFAPADQKSELKNMVVERIHQALNSPFPGVQKIGATMIMYAPEDQRPGLFLSVIQNTKVLKIMIEPPLYETSSVTTSDFSRAELSKTGSKATVIGGALRNMIIIRNLSPSHFQAWKDLYEDYNFWKEQGFEYVPVEPIVSFHIQKDSSVAVAAGVLDLNLSQWMHMTDLFGKELLAQQKKILSALQRKGFDHGHPHDDNFCLRFLRDTQGDPDITVPPRMYLIDFDQALSS
jgi:hypothetical protein